MVSVLSLLLLLSNKRTHFKPVFKKIHTWCKKQNKIQLLRNEIKRDIRTWRSNLVMWSFSNILFNGKDLADVSCEFGKQEVMVCDDRRCKEI